ncbi:MAG: FHA domain-containing protein [Aggregatilineales bacterium]
MADLRAIFTLTGPDLPTDRAEVGTETFTIGRAPGNSLQLNNSRVSRHHADITYAYGQFLIEDLESANGTYVNDVRIETKKPSPIRPGDILRLGPFTMTFERIAEAAAPKKPKPVVEPKAEPSAELRSPSGDGASTPVVEAAGPPKPAEPPAVEAPAPPAVYVSQPPTPPGEARTKQPKPTQPPAVSVEPAAGVAAAAFAFDVELGKPTYPPSTNGHRVLAPYKPIEGVPTEGSRYLQYLPGVFSDADFLKRYLLIMESILAPLEWGIDSFEQYYNPLVTTPDWLQWIGEWFDVLIHPSLPVARQRAVVKELGVLFLQRGTRRGLERLLELYFGVQPVIEELDNPPSTFKVSLPLGKEDSPLNRSLAARLITTYKPAHTAFTVEFA